MKTITLSSSDTSRMGASRDAALWLLIESARARLPAEAKHCAPRTMERAWRHGLEATWLALDLAFAPTSSPTPTLIQAEDEFEWPPLLTERLRALPIAATRDDALWLELRRAREQQTLALPLGPQPHGTGAGIVNLEEMALLWNAALDEQGLEKLSAWINATRLAQLSELLALLAWGALQAEAAVDPDSPNVLLTFELRHDTLEALLELVTNVARARRQSDIAPKNVVAGTFASESSTPTAIDRPPFPEAVSQGDDVQFTVFRPNEVAPARWSEMLAFAHLASKRPNAASDSPEPLEVVEKQAQALLGQDLARYRQLSEDAAAPVPYEGQLTFLPEVTGVEFDPPSASFRWIDDVHRVEFRLRPAAGLAGTTARGQLSVLCGSILLAEITLSLRVTQSAEIAPKASATVPQQASMYRKIFASYSHRDAAVVEQFRAFAKTLGDRYLIDVADLRAGENWSDALEKLICDADVFQLFWSWNSIRSPFVRREWEYALSLGRPNFLRPTYWEQPLPALPEEGLPPPSLAALHFQSLTPTAISPATPSGATQPLDEAAPTEPTRSLARGAVVSSVPSVPHRPRRTRAWLGPLSGAVAAAAALLLVIKTGSMTTPPTASQVLAPSANVQDVKPILVPAPDHERPSEEATAPEVVELDQAVEPQGDHKDKNKRRASSRDVIKPKSKSDPRSIEDLLGNATAEYGDDSKTNIPPSKLPRQLSKDEVLSVLQAMQPAVQACAQDQGGTALVRLTIHGPTGRVTQVEVEGVADAVSACIARVARRTEFKSFQLPEFKVKYPFEL